MLEPASPAAATPGMRSGPPTVVLSSPRRVPVLSHPAPAYKKVAELIQAEAAAMVEDDTQRAQPRWERLPAGTRLRVWWEGCEDYFDCKILDWRVSYNDEKELVYTHRCVYPGGTIEHDLSSVDFEVVDEFLDDDSDDENQPLQSNAIPLSPRRKWLLRQEVGDDTLQDSNRSNEAELGGAQTKIVVGLHGRGRLAMRRVRQRAADLLKSPLRRNAAAMRTMDTFDSAYRI